MVLGPAVRGTTGPRTTCPGGQFFGGTSGPATPEPLPGWGRGGVEEGGNGGTGMGEGEAK